MKAEDTINCILHQRTASPFQMGAYREPFPCQSALSKPSKAVSVPEFHGFQGQSQQNCGTGEVRGHFCQRVVTLAARGSLTKNWIHSGECSSHCSSPAESFFYLVMKILQNCSGDFMYVYINPLVPVSFCNNRMALLTSYLFIRIVCKYEKKEKADDS